MTYAKTTSIPAERTKADIEKLVRKYGAKGFQAGWEGTQQWLSFIAHDRHIRFSLIVPDNNPQVMRSKWRTLLLLVKAKLEAVDAKIATFEEAFIGDVVMPSGKTVYETARAGIALAYKDRDPNVMLLGGPK